MPTKKNSMEPDDTAGLTLEDPHARLVPAARVFCPGETVELVIPDDPIRRYPAEIMAREEKKVELQTSGVGEFGGNQRLPAMLIKTKTSRLFYLEGNMEPAAGRIGRMLFNHEGRALRTQRRLFHRFHFRKKFNLEGITLADGTQRLPMPATLQDCSLIGLGFQAESKLPPQTVLKSPDLFRATPDEVKDLVFYLQIIWSKGNYMFGFRHGAIFKFQSESEQANFNRIVEQLQLKQLSACYRNFIAG